MFFQHPFRKHQYVLAHHIFRQLLKFETVLAQSLALEAKLLKLKGCVRGTPAYNIRNVNHM